jgi:hypothetical protein
MEKLWETEKRFGPTRLFGSSVLASMVWSVK